MTQPNAKRQLALFIEKVSGFLKLLEEMGVIFANIRLENIIIKYNSARTEIENIRFLNFGHLIPVEESENLNIPDQFDHLPPNMLKYLQEQKSFSSPNLQNSLPVKAKAKTDFI